MLECGKASTHTRKVEGGARKPHLVNAATAVGIPDSSTEIYLPHSNGDK